MPYKQNWNSCSFKWNLNICFHTANIPQLPKWCWEPKHSQEINANTFKKYSIIFSETAECKTTYDALYTKYSQHNELGTRKNVRTKNARSATGHWNKCTTQCHSSKSWYLHYKLDYCNVSNVHSTSHHKRQSLADVNSYLSRTRSQIHVLLKIKFLLVK